MYASPLLMDRRTLLAAGASLAAAPLASGLAEAPMEPVRVGVIGIGIRGRNLMNRTLIGKEGVLVTAVCDVDLNRRLDAKRRVDEVHGLDCVATDRHEEVLSVLSSKTRPRQTRSLRRTHCSGETNHWQPPQITLRPLNGAKRIDACGSCSC